MLEVLKDLLNITDISKDTVLNHNLNKARKSIQSYLNYTDAEFIEAEDNFSTQIVDLAMYLYKNRNSVGISQQSQGSRSQSMEKGIPQEIKDSLPLPRVRVCG